MTNSAYGYLELVDDQDIQLSLLQAIAKKYGLGIYEESLDTMDDYPISALPAESTRNLFVSITDNPEVNDADHLLDCLDYPKDYFSDLPSNGLDRLSLIVNVLTDIIATGYFSKVVMAMSECGEIESVEEVQVDELPQKLEKDFREYAPPNKIYIIRG